nr:serpin family protein [candidate division Zixibacteria bacterium]
MKLNFLLVPLMALMVIIGGGRSGNPPLAATPLQEGQNPLDGNLITSQTKFAFDFQSELYRTNPGKNCFISPLSAALALAMTYNGANGETKEAMEDALHLRGFNPGQVNAFFKKLMVILQNTDPKIELNIANSIWYRRDLDFKQSFFNLVKENYNAHLEPLTDAETINHWVDEKTKGRINRIIDSIDPADMMVLINALYFKGMWASEFKEEKTLNDEFALAVGNKIIFPLMRQDGKFRYLENDSFQAINLPYGDKHMSMYVFLPRENYSLDGFMQTLGAENWNDWQIRFRECEGEIRLPKFKMEYEQVLNDILFAMGMGIAFDPVGADFSAMYEPQRGTNLYISIVKQKTFLEVNEKGTEAAAVTAVKMKLTAARPDEERKFLMVVNRPFFMAIVDNQTGIILFTGAITDPRG